MGGTKHLVDVYLTSTASPSGSGKAKGLAGAESDHAPPTFFLLLVSAINQQLNPTITFK